MNLSTLMTYTLAAGLLALAVRGIVAPRDAALGYGLAVPDGDEPSPFLEVKANRDAVLAGLLVVAASGSGRVLSQSLLVGTLAPLADASTVARHGRAAGTAIHLGTAAYLLVAAGFAAAGR